MYENAGLLIMQKAVPNLSNQNLTFFLVTLGKRDTERAQREYRSVFATGLFTSMKLKPATVPGSPPSTYGSALI